MAEYASFSFDATHEIACCFIEFTHKVTDLMQVWRIRLQETKK